ncbi:MAG: HAMP domain-containing histidine kinase [Deltaproteobacteria bacterium]|nr:HAMP domain-containing histidine kinase [Deltaproteobacteria bacterium]
MRHDVVRATRVCVVGGAFLAWRPLIVLPVVAAQGALSATMTIPATQRTALAIAMLTTLGLFTIEGRLARRRVVSERWLFASLAGTALLITVGLALTGGVSSPLLVLVLAPLVVAFAAFGRRRATARLLAGVVLAVGVMAILTSLDALPWGPLPSPAVDWMRLVAFAGAAALAWTGVARLADAYAEAGALLERMRLEAVAAATTRLREAEEVSARLAHELKNPLAAMKALVQLEARSSATSGRTGERLAVVLDEIDRMDALVKDHLALARAHVALRPEPVDAAELVGEIVTLLAPRAERRGVRLEASASPAPMVVDRARLREALFNLVDNAVAASPDDGIVTIEHTASATGCRIVVADRGPGLDPRIAAAFEVGDSSWLTTRPDGTGLGLVIARAVVLAHGGRLALRPRDGGGTVATVDLPMEAR